MFDLFLFLFLRLLIISLIINSFAGNSIKGTSETHANMGLLGGKALDVAAAKEIAIGTKKMDDLINDLAQVCCVTLMPGQHDIATFMMPQKPLHPCMFPQSRRYFIINFIIKMVYFVL